MPAKKKAVDRKIEKTEDPMPAEEKTHLVEESETGALDSPKTEPERTGEAEKTEAVVSVPPVSTEPAVSPEISPPVAVDPVPNPAVNPESPQIIVNTTASDQQVYTAGDDGSSKKKILSVVTVALLVVGLAVGGYFLYANFLGTSPGTPDATVSVVEPSPPPVPAGETQPEESLDLTKFPVEVRNGTEKKGEAVKLKEALEADGFVVSKVGNAADSDHLLTEIAVGMDVPQNFIDKLKEVLSKSYQLATESGKLDDSPAGALVTIGSELTP